MRWDQMSLQGIENEDSEVPAVVAVWGKYEQLGQVQVEPGLELQLTGKCEQGPQGLDSEPQVVSSVV